MSHTFVASPPKLMLRPVCRAGARTGPGLQRDDREGATGGLLAVLGWPHGDGVGIGGAVHGEGKADAFEGPPLGRGTLVVVGAHGFLLVRWRVGHGWPLSGGG